MPSKSKAPGGKQISVKALKAQKKNSGAAAEYVSEVCGNARNVAEEANQKELRLGLAPTHLCRVSKLLGSGRILVITQQGKELQVTLRGNLKCSAGAARNPANPLALTPGSYVLVDDQIMAVLSQQQVAAVKEVVFSVRGFFETGAKEEDCGVEFEAAAEGEGEDEEDLDIGAI